MALKILSIMAAFAAIVLTPINMRYLGPLDFSQPSNGIDSDSIALANLMRQNRVHLVNGATPWPFGYGSEIGLTQELRFNGGLAEHDKSVLAARVTAGLGLDDADVYDEPEDGDKGKKHKKQKETKFLWAYLIFTYFFSGLTLYTIDKETFKVLDIRQTYLARQLTITDRTFRLSGFSENEKSEEKIQKLVHKLGIGKVEKVTLCRHWKALDEDVSNRHECLMKLERAWAEYHENLEKQSRGREGGRSRRSQDSGASGERNGRPNSQDAGEEDGLLESGSDGFEEKARPKVRIWYGFLRLRYRKRDAIDYYEEQLRQFDARIRKRRTFQELQKTKPADIAFVTMDSIAACQMAIQTLIDPRPGHLLTKAAPSPRDVVWRNTYADRRVRRAKRWAINILVFALSVVWLIIVAFLASLLSICTIKKAFPGVANYLQNHEWIRILVQSGIPTVAVSLLNVSVPFLYDYLSHHQGNISRGQVELSFITKNFFFNFFNIFLVSAISGSTAQLLPVLWDALDSTSKLPKIIAQSIMNLADLYISFVVLQGVGLLPFRLLEPGGITQYVRAHYMARTPREKLEAQKPPVFSYGYYLPTAILIFILCLVYSILKKGVFILLAGVVYFFIGYYTYKYQLLYAMDDPGHSTGAVWSMICYRIFLGLFFFQITMTGFLGLQKAFWPALLVLPLMFATVWYGYWYFRRRYDPLTRYISLRSIKDAISPQSSDEDEDEDDEEVEEDDERETSRSWTISRASRSSRGLHRKGSTVDEERERGMKFENPSIHPQ